MDYVTTLSPALLQRAKDELGEDEDFRIQNVNALREWLSQQPHLQCCSLGTIDLLKVLRGCKYNVETAKKKIDLTLTLRNALPEFFSGWDPLLPEMQSALQCGGFLPLPVYDQLGRRVIVFRTGSYDTCKMSFELLQRANFMVWDIMGEEEEQMFITGLVLIFDMDGYNFNHFSRTPLSLIRKLLPCWQDAPPLRPQSIHFVRTSHIFNTVFRLVVSFVKEKIKNRLKVHGHDFQSLHKEIRKEVLPKDYGGDGMSLQELTDFWKARAEERREWLLERQKFKADESKRPRKAPKSSAD